MAVGFGGGSQSQELSQFSSRNNFSMHIAGGPTVGLAGGYMQGGGHSSWSPTHGLMADNVLQIGAVTANGKYVIANARENSDLFWAFRGGGGGMYLSIVFLSWGLPT